MTLPHPTDTLDDAVIAAADAWRDTGPSRRGQLLLEWAALCREQAPEIEWSEVKSVIIDGRA
jgi:acyl-CoA reductase-like NAD-dependent aldehyde dehydrogenase